jgi:CHAT domain-containing protein
VGDVFLELADLLLQRADGLRDSAAAVQCIREAQDTCERLKSVELEDYFQDDCVHLLQSKRKTVEATLKEITQGAAVVYIVPLPDRTEIIVSTAAGLERVKMRVTAAALTDAVRAWRVHLETRTTHEYLTEAAQLYDWLIRPIEPLLTRGKIDTLVFVPDGALRTVPMAALHDGQKFLIEKYAVAVTPGLTLMEPRAIKRVEVSLMASGLSQAVRRDGEDFPALPFVEKEIGELSALYGGRKLLNGDFLTETVAREFDAQAFSVVHIASHGQFSGDVKKTFVLTYDGQISLNRLEQMIRPRQLREQPVELLSLSACQTAAGDDRAALGLAGVAVKAGARAAFATLWFVSDEASTHLIADFYGALRSQPELSKAQALRGAQRKLLAEPRYSHPCLWAPYLIIGNWL